MRQPLSTGRESSCAQQFFQIFLQKRELILADFHVDGGKIIRVQKLYDALRVRILDGQFVPVGGKGDLHVLQFLDKVGKILSGNGDVAFFENFRVDFFLYGDLAVGGYKRQSVVLRRNFNTFQNGVGGLGAARLDDFHNRIGKIQPFAYNFHKNLRNGNEFPFPNGKNDTLLFLFIGIIFINMFC